MGRLLLIVSSTEPARYAYLQHVFASQTLEVILDRRAAQRRQREASRPFERRRADRRVRNLSGELQQFGWALVRR